MPGQHNNATKEDRSKRAIAIAEEMNLAYRKALVGTVQEVLFEEAVDGFDTGHTPNYMKVYVPATGRHNEVVSVKITEIYADGLLGIVD
jgi:threonylcarbamoyladenosine tRNA methylthiotransferase MtaB